MLIGITLLLALSHPRPERNWRVGMGISEPLPEYWADVLGAGWVLDWRASPHHALRVPRYWLMVRTFPDRNVPDLSRSVEIAQTHPGNIWIIGNEPDNPFQDALPPEEYAERYARFYVALKAADPTCKIAIAGVTQPSALRMRYLERVLTHYEALTGDPMPVDIWTIHGYVLREQKGEWGAEIPVGLSDEQGLLIEPSQHGDVEMFKTQIIAFRKWMKEHGYQDSPLAITEMGILLPEAFGFSSDRVSRYLTETFEWLNTAQDMSIGYPQDDGRLVQQWAWFSLADSIFPVSNLVNSSTGELTPVGEAFQSFTISHLR